MSEPKPVSAVSPSDPTTPHASVVAVLGRDHELILRGIVAIERCVARLHAPGEVDGREREHFAFLTRFFREFAEGVHDAKEEEVLIPALVGAGAPSETGILREVMDTHLQATEFLARASAARPERAVDAVGAYGELVRQHLRAEEHSLFPLVNRLLDPEGEGRVLLGFRQLDERAGSERGYDAFDGAIAHLLAPLDELYPDRKRPW